MNNRPKYIVVGRLGRPRHVFGDIYITPATDDPARFADLKKIIVVGDGQRQTFEIEKFSMVGGRPVIKLKGVDSREKAADLTGFSIEIPIEEARTLPDGQYYRFDLIGCRVSGQNGENFGEIVDIEEYPASDILKIRSEVYGEILLPAIDIFIISVDTEKKEIIIDPPQGLFDSEKSGNEK